MMMMMMMTTMTSHREEDGQDDDSFVALSGVLVAAVQVLVPVNSVQLHRHRAHHTKHVVLSR